MKPLLEEKAFHEDKRRIGFVSLMAFTDGIVSHEHIFDSRPIDDGIDFGHSFDSTVFFYGKEERDR